MQLDCLGIVHITTDFHQCEGVSPIQRGLHSHITAWGPYHSS